MASAPGEGSPHLQELLGRDGQCCWGLLNSCGVPRAAVLLGFLPRTGERKEPTAARRSSDGLVLPPQSSTDRDSSDRASSVGKEENRIRLSFL